MKYCHDVFHDKDEKKTCFKRYNHRQENVTTKIDDYKYQGEFTRHRRQNSMYHMKKYSRRGDKMNVRQPDEKRIVGTENLKETSLIKDMITVLTDEKPI